MPTINIVNARPAEIRSLAKTALSGLWVKLIICLLISEAIISYIPAIISLFVPTLRWTYTFDYMGTPMQMVYSALPVIFLAIFNGPFMLSISKINLKIIRERNIETKDIFYGFRYFIKAFVTQFFMGLITLIFILPIMILFLGIGGALLRGGGILQAVGAMITTAGLLVVMTAVMYILLLISMTFYRLSDVPNLKPLAAIKESISIMKPNVLKLLMLRFTFIGWGLLALLLSQSITTLLGTGLPEALSIVVNIIGGIPLVLFSAYMRMGDAFFYEFAMGHIMRAEPVATSFNQPTSA